MGEIDNLHKSENQAQADRHQGVDEPHEQSADDCLDKQVCRHTTSRCAS